MSQTPTNQPQQYAKDTLRPLPMRITQLSYERLDKLRTLDGLAIQEHVRRAIDYYLEHAELVLVLARSGHVGNAIEAIKADPLHPADQNTIPNLLATRNPLKVGQR